MTTAKQPIEQWLIGRRIVGVSAFTENDVRWAELELDDGRRIQFQDSHPWLVLGADGTPQEYDSVRHGTT